MIKFYSESGRSSIRHCVPQDFASLKDLILFRYRLRAPMVGEDGKCRILEIRHLHKIWTSLNDQILFRERETGFEPATSSLATRHSTTELLPRKYYHNIILMITGAANRSRTNIRRSSGARLDHLGYCGIGGYCTLFAKKIEENVCGDRNDNCWYEREIKIEAAKFDGEIARDSKSGRVEEIEQNKLTHPDYRQHRKANSDGI